MRDLVLHEHRREQAWRDETTVWLAQALEVLSCRVFTYPAGWNSGMRRLAHGLMLLPTGSGIVVEEEGRKLTVGSGDAAVVRRGRPFRIIVAGRRADFISVHLDATDRARRSWFDGMPEHRLRACASQAVRGRLLDATHLHLLDGVASRDLAALAVRELVLAWFDRGGRTRLPPELDPLIARLIHLAQDRLQSGITAHDLRRASGLGETRFRLRFQQATGVAPARFLADLRLQRVAELLHTSNLSVKAIAARCGFSDDRYLHACFRARFGRSPLRYRETVRPRDYDPSGA